MKVTSYSLPHRQSINSSSIALILSSHFWVSTLLFFLKSQIFYLFFFTILYWFCHTSTWIHHGCTRVPNPEPHSHLPPQTIPLGHPSAPAPNLLYPASNLDWWFISYMILYMFPCHSPKSSQPLPLPQQEIFNDIILTAPLQQPWILVADWEILCQKYKVFWKSPNKWKCSRSCASILFFPPTPAFLFW